MRIIDFVGKDFIFVSDAAASHLFSNYWALLMMHLHCVSVAAVVENCEVRNGQEIVSSSEQFFCCLLQHKIQWAANEINYLLEANSLT